MRTESGKALLEKYENSSTTDVYIGIGKDLPDKAAATTEKAKYKKGKVDRPNSVFDGLTIKNPSKKLFLIQVSPNIANDANYNKYEKASVLFHELMAHVDLAEEVNKIVSEKIKVHLDRFNLQLQEAVNSGKSVKELELLQASIYAELKEIVFDLTDEISHSKKFYGSKGSGYNTEIKVEPGTPAATIGLELRTLELNDKKQNELWDSGDKPIKKFGVRDNTNHVVNQKNE